MSDIIDKKGQFEPLKRDYAKIQEGSEKKIGYEIAERIIDMIDFVDTNFFTTVAEFENKSEFEGNEYTSWTFSSLIIHAIQQRLTKWGIKVEIMKKNTADFIWDFKELKEDTQLVLTIVNSLNYDPFSFSIKVKKTNTIDKGKIEVNKQTEAGKIVSQARSATQKRIAIVLTTLALSAGIISRKCSSSHDTSNSNLDASVGKR